MASESFARDLRVSAAPDTCWAVLTDVGTLASWITVLRDVREIDRLERYSVVLADDVGAMRLQAELDVRVDVLEEGRAARVTASGRDVRVDSGITVDATLQLEVGQEETSVRVAGSYAVTGRVATLGAGTIREKAGLILEEFSTRAGPALGAVDAGGAGTAGNGTRVAGGST